MEVGCCCCSLNSMAATVHAAAAVDAANADAEAQERPVDAEAAAEAALVRCRTHAAQQPRRNWEEGPTPWSWSMMYDLNHNCIRTPVCRWHPHTGCTPATRNGAATAALFNDLAF